MDCKNYKCKKRLGDKLVEECTESIDEVKIAELTLTENMLKCSSCILYIVLISIILRLTLELELILFTTNIRIAKRKKFSDMMMSIKQQVVNINGKY